MKPTPIYFTAILMSIILALACGKGGADEKTLSRLYNDYHTAIRDGDAAALKKYISAKRQKELLGKGAAFKLQMIKEFLPTDIKITGTSASGSTAQLEVTGKNGGQRMTGTVQFVKEGGRWKIDKEDWQMSFEMPSGAGPFMEDPKKPPQVHRVLAGHQGEVTALAFTPDYRYLVSVSYGDYSIRVWDTQTWEEISRASTPKRVRGMALSPDGQRVVTAGAYNNITVWPLDFGIVGTPQILAKKMGDALALSPDGNFIAVTGWQLPVQLLDLATGQWIRTITEKTDRRVLVFDASGKILAGGGIGNNYSIWDAKNWQESRRTIAKIGGDSEITSMDTSKDGKYLASGHNDSSIVIFDLKTREELHNYFVRDAATRDVKFSLDSKVLATAHQDKKIYLWEAKTAGTLGVLQHHTGAVACLAFSPDGSSLASGGEDRKIVIWRTGPPTPTTPVPDAPGTDAPGNEDISTPHTTGVDTVQAQGKQNLVKNPDAHQAALPWNIKGEVSIETGAEGNHLFVIRYSGMFRQEIPLGEADARYVLLIAWASSERVNPGQDRTGYPYLYGYFTDKTGVNKINEYLQGDQMVLSPNSAGEWGLIYGIFQVPENTGVLHLFMQQADGRTSHNGSAARFDAPGVFLFDTEAEAREFLAGY